MAHHHLLTTRAGLGRRKKTITMTGTTTTDPQRQPLVFTADNPDHRYLDFPAGTVVAVHHGDYRRQEVWVASGPNAGNWSPVGGEFDCPPTGQDGVPEHPVFADILARGPVTLLVAAQQTAYEAGWVKGRSQLLGQIEELRDTGDCNIPPMPTGEHR